MKSENVKTVIGLIVISLIVVATFLYGNSQRQAQLKTQDDTKHQQATQTTAASAAPTPDGASITTNNTAPVASPSANTIQGGSTTANGTAAGAPAASPKPQAVAGTAIPDTGSSTSALLGMSMMLVALAYWRSGRRILGAALRTPRG